MSDLIRALESDLFGSFEWSADLYEDLKEVPEAADRLAITRGLFRAYEELDGRDDDAMTAAEAMVAAEAELSPDEVALLAPLAEARDQLFETASPEAAQAFLDVFLPAWAVGPEAHESLVADGLLAALAQSNVMASRGVGEPAALHRASAILYADIATILQKRLTRGVTLWQETAASAVNRRVVALRLAGDESSARRLAEETGAGEFVPSPGGNPRKPGL